jgi:hypothetical protein
VQNKSLKVLEEIEIFILKFAASYLMVLKLKIEDSLVIDLVVEAEEVMAVDEVDMEEAVEEGTVEVAEEVMGAAAEEGMEEVAAVMVVVHGEDMGEEAAEVDHSPLEEEEEVDIKYCINNVTTIQQSILEQQP